MTNAEQFEKTFGIYAEEFWSYTEKQMLDWINTDVPDINVGDLISRQAAIDAIIEDKICDSSLKIMTAIGDGDKAETLNMTCDRHAKMLMGLPSAQPEIIWCKGCKHSRFFDPCFYCYEFGGEIIVPENGFCFMAERRTDDGE